LKEELELVTHSTSEPSLVTIPVIDDPRSDFNPHSQELEVCRMDRNPEIVIVDYGQEEII